MSKRVDIEYCGSWGYGGPANRLKKSIQDANPGVEVNSRSAQGKTGKIAVRIVDSNGAITEVWANGKAETEANHAQIVAKLKAEGLWSKKPCDKKNKLIWEGILKLMGFLWTLLIFLIN
jgi:selT/selW/selH-like putative selenoprotein